VDAANLHPILARHVSKESRLMSDGWKVYRGVGWNFADYAWVDHGRDEYVSKQDATIHINTVEGYFSILKRGLTGV
jgi:hypothetical protein